MSKTAWSTLSREQGATSKGFTGHEMLDEVGVIHMGGRIYDPALGRFMGADPIIKGITNVESYNRYSYVLNNPMSLTDPTGYSWLGDAFEKLGDSIEKHFREILIVTLPGVAMLEASVRYGGRELARFAARNKFAGEIIGLVGVAACAFATGGSGAAGCVSSYQGIVSSSMAYGSGEPIGKALAAGARASALAFANASIAGSIGAQSLGPVSSGVLHGIRGGVFAGIMGGDFRSGFTGGFTEGALGRFIGKQGWGADPGSGTVIAGFISGTVSEVTGGKFAVGAFSGAMGYLFNEVASGRAQKGQVYDSNDSNYHAYTLRTGMCNDGENGCSVGMVMGITEAQSVPFETDPGTGKPLTLFGGNPINHYRGENWSLNVTTEGHTYHPGQVLHVVASEQGVVYLNTFGSGTGPNPMLNTVVGYTLFGKMHADVFVGVKIQQIKNFYGGLSQ